ncbi:hypothetical protein Y695_03824 [Hydrogenophaga sp. T4]|nr:hypothetical protein Y695_03824 [Hydrogenophaga sp. T4]
MASTLSASSAAISDGRNTATNTSRPTTLESCTALERPARPPILSIPAVRVRLVVRLRSTVATIQPTPPITNAATALGSMSSVLATMSRSGSSRPCISSAPRMAGTNSRITSQNRAPARLSLMGSMSACSDSFSSSELRSSSFCVIVRTRLATSQATSANTRPASRRGAYSNTLVISALKGPDTIARSSELKTAISVTRITAQNRPSHRALDVHTVAGEAAEAVVDAGKAQALAHGGAHQHGDEPAQHENGQGPQQLGNVAAQAVLQGLPQGVHVHGFSPVNGSNTGP